MGANKLLWILSCIIQWANLGLYSQQGVRTDPKSNPDMTITRAGRV
jgi:hypothetical protein